MSEAEQPRMKLGSALLNWHQLPLEEPALLWPYPGLHFPVNNPSQELVLVVDCDDAYLDLLRDQGMNL